MRTPYFGTLWLTLVFSVFGLCWQPAMASEPPIHEEQWIVDSIGRDIAEMVLFADNKNGKPEIKLDALDLETKEVTGTPDKFSYQLKWGATDSPQEMQFGLVDYAWSPDNYAPWAKQLIEQCGLKVTAPTASAITAPTIPASTSPAASTTPSTEASTTPTTTGTTPSNAVTSTPSSAASKDIVSVFGNFSSESIAKENKRISSGLTDHPLDPSLHEQAALLCALYGLRESAACFTEVRPAINRISAHLSMAKALRDGGEYSDAGKIAQLAMMCLSGREAVAVTQIDSLSSVTSSTAMKSWLRALKVRATRDYRIADLEKASLVERLEYGRALADDLSSDSLSDYLEKNKAVAAVDTIDWFRIGLRGLGSVESGHRYAEPVIEAEAADFVQDFHFYKDRGFKDGSEANAELSHQPGRCLVLLPSPHLEAVSWPSLSAFHARHLLDGIFQRYYFELVMWGVPEQATQLEVYADKSFAAVRLYPLCKLSLNWMDRKKTDPSLASSLKDLYSKNPQDVNADLWHRIGYCAVNESEIPSPYAWFVPRFPFGTAFDFTHRFVVDDPHLSKAELLALLKLSPYQSSLIFQWVCAEYDDKATADQYTAAYGPLAEVSLSAMRRIADANKNDPAKHAESLEKMARYKPDSYFALGDYYLAQSQPEKALKAYENGVKLGRDSVMMANGCGWLVNYYYDHGQKDKALELAKNAAEVYSFSGLMTMAKLDERMNKLSEAEHYIKQLSERYDTPEELCQFYLQHKENSAAYKQAGEKMLKEIFPHGLTKIQAGALTGPPKDGVKIEGESDLTRQYGLKSGDIFVGVDGYAVQNKKQYGFVRTMSSNPKMEFTVWTGKEYRVVKVELPKRRFYCDISDVTTGN
jgi:tetratricopeptide (TPR) repeat protein